MYQDIKNGYARAKRFVEEHPTASACAATAVVSWKMSKRHTLKKVAGEVTELAYKWGNEAGRFELERDILLDFVHTNNLNDDVREFVSNLG